MAFTTQILEVATLIPDSLEVEREAVDRIVADWNQSQARRRAVMLTSRPWAMTESEAADLMIGVFHTRLGPAGQDEENQLADSVRRHHAAGKPLALCFSTQAVAADHDPHRHRAMLVFKRWAQDEGLVETFDGAHALRRTLLLRLPLLLNDSPYVRDLTDEDFTDVFAGHLEDGRRLIGRDAGELLLKAATAPAARLTVHQHPDGADVIAGMLNFTKNQTAREVARWLGAVRELFSKGLVADVSGRGEIYCVTHEGFLAADGLDRQEGSGAGR